MTLKERIRSGVPFCIGALAMDLPPDELPAAICGKGWDLAFVDLQHAPYTEPQLADFCRRATALGVPLLPRVPHPSAAWQVSRVLDFGAAGVLVPMVEEPAVVQAAVANFYYPPAGKRSCGLRFAYGWSGKNEQTPRAYADWWNANGILALQVETVQGVLDCRRLVQSGVDLILFGATDLSFSLQTSPDCPFKSVAECQRYVVEQTRDMNVRIGVSDLPFGQF